MSSTLSTEADQVSSGRRTFLARISRRRLRLVRSVAATLDDRLDCGHAGEGRQGREEGGR